MFVATHAGRPYLFDGHFDDALDTHPDCYRVYRLAPEDARAAATTSWEGLCHLGEFVAEIAVADVRFDATRRAAVHAAVFDRLHDGPAPLASLHVSDQQLASVLALSGPERYAHLIKRVADEKEIWSLRGEGGWILAGEAGRELVPVWPHPRYASACTTGDWAGAEPAAIPLDEWLAAWLPGLERDGRAVAVFPTPGGKGVVVEATRLRADLEAELSRYD